MVNERRLGKVDMRSLVSTIACAVVTLLIPSLNAESRAQERSDRANLTRSTSGFTYFNRPGANIIAHDEAVRMCVSRSNALSQFTDNQVFKGLVPDLIADAQDDARLKANLENCMVVAGWRVIRLPPQEGRALGGIGKSALAERLAPWVGLDQPHGTIARTFSNEAARGDTVWGAMPGGGGTILSLKATDLSNLPLPSPPPAQVHPERHRLPVSPPIPVAQLTPDNIASLPAGTALAIIKVVGTGRTNGEGLGIGRVDARSTPPLMRTVATDPVENLYAAVKWTLFKGSDREVRETLLAVPIIPSDYRVESRMNTMEYCLGAPVTTIREGDVVFLGAFDIAGQTLGPDLDLEPARTFLANDPARLARLRPAEWRNGHTFACSLVYFYALEFPATPFEPEYEGGSNLKASILP